MKKLEGKVALITGGTSGIGLATAKLFHAEGARVLVTGSNPKTLQVAADELRGIAEVIASDAGDSAQVRELFAKVQREQGALDVLFLNAGIVRGGLLADSPESTFDDIFRINVKGPWLSLQAAIPVLRPGAAVVLNGSINAHLGMPGTSAYAASKAALRSLARTAAAELAERGVRVNVVSPGPTDSGIIGKSYGKENVAAIHARLSEKILMKRLGTTEEIAQVALFLASTDSSFMTGEEIVVDGGMTRV